MIVLLYRAVVFGSGGEGLAVNGDWVIDEEFDSHGGEARGGWSTGAVLRRFVGKEELGAIDGEARDGVIEVPENGGAECGFVEIDGGFGIGDREHWGDLGWHAGLGLKEFSIGLDFDERVGCASILDCVYGAQPKWHATWMD